jgi:peptidoglycan L-alanyl-D-glutamate endopeptidase CwlK
MKNEQLLNQCTEQLRGLFRRVDTIVPVEILPSTIRTRGEQKAFFAAGTSKTMNSKHLISPEHPFSRAVDAGPYPHRWPQEGSKDFWKDWARLYYFAGVVVIIAREMKIAVRYGGDWNGNFELKDENFFDGVHFELRD